MKQKHSQEFEPISHRADLADLIIKKSLQIKQDQTADSFYFFVARPFPRSLAFLVLLIAFFFGFSKASQKYDQPQFTEQKSVIEEIYYSNSYFL